VISKRAKCGLTGLRWALGVVILIEAALFLMPNGRHDFSMTHMPNGLRLILGWGEILGAILLLIPRTSVRGAWILGVLFAFAIVVHLLHGMTNVGSLVVYTAAACAIALGGEFFQ
jgi:hypothetical protein